MQEYGDLFEHSRIVRNSRNPRGCESVMIALSLDDYSDGHLLEDFPEEPDRSQRSLRSKCSVSLSECDDCQDVRAGVLRRVEIASCLEDKIASSALGSPPKFLESLAGARNKFDFIKCLYQPQRSSDDAIPPIGSTPLSSIFKSRGTKNEPLDSVKTSHDFYKIQAEMRSSGQLSGAGAHRAVILKSHRQGNASLSPPPPKDRRRGSHCSAKRSLNDSDSSSTQNLSPFAKNGLQYD